VIGYFFLIEGELDLDSIWKISLQGVQFPLLHISHCRSRVLHYSRSPFQRWKPKKGETCAEESSLGGKRKGKRGRDAGHRTICL